MTGSGVPGDGDVAVVVVAWNAAHRLRGCLDALAAQTLAAPVWVVDNGSQDATASVVADLARERPGLHLLRCDTNRGFAGGVALALARVTAPFVVLVNDDAVLDPGCLAALAEGFRSAPDPARVAAVTARVLLDARFAEASPGTPVPPGGWRREDGTVLLPARDAPPGSALVDIVHSTGVELTASGNGADRGWLERADTHHPPADVFAFCGAVVMLRAAAVAAVGGFDPALFLYYEDTDVAWRLRLHGWTVRYAEEALVRHAHAASSAGQASRARYFNERNRLLVVARNGPARTAAVLTALHPLGTLARLAGPGRDPVTAAARARAYRDYLRRLPGVLATRRTDTVTARVRRVTFQGARCAIRGNGL